MRRAVQITKVSRRLLRESHAPFSVAPYPPATWVVTGPRGGRYLATGARTRQLREDLDNDFVMNIVSVVDVSDGVRYIRPGSRLARELATTD